MFYAVNCQRLQWLESNNVIIIVIRYFVGNGSDSSTTANNVEQCDCINQCYLVTYSSTVSAGRLAHNNILTEISNNLEHRVAKNFWNALEVGQRVDEDEMLSTVQLLKLVSDAHDQLQSEIKYYAVTEGTSISTQLLSVAMSLFEMVQGSVKLSYDLHGQMDNIYKQYVDHLVTDVTSAMQRADTLYAQFTTTFVNTDNYDNDQLDQLVTQLDAVNNKLLDFENNLNKTTALASQFFPKRLLSSKACLDAKNSLNSTIVERIDWLYGFPSPSKFVAATDLRKGSYLRSSLSLMISCLQAYKTELDRFRSWLESVNLPKFDVIAVSTTYSDVVRSDGDKLRDVQLRFVGGSMTKNDLAETYLTELEKIMEANANSLVSDVKDSVFTKLKANVDVFKDMMETFFKTLFGTYVNLQKYMDSADKGIEMSARRLDIWRKPVVNFQSSKVHKFSLLKRNRDCDRERLGLPFLTE